LIKSKNRNTFFRYKIILDTDAKWFGGNGRTQESAEFRTDPLACDKRNNSLLVSLNHLLMRRTQSRGSRAAYGRIWPHMAAYGEHSNIQCSPRRFIKFSNN